MSSPQPGPGVTTLPPRPGGGSGGGGGTLSKIVVDAPLTGGTIVSTGSIGLAIGSGLTVAAGTLEATAVSSEWTAGAVDTLGPGLSLAASSITWNPADKAAIVVLSGGNDTASVVSGSATTGMVRASSSVSSGKWYFEQEFTTIADPQNFYFGLANATESLSAFVGQTDNSIGTKPHGEIIFDNSGAGSITAFTAGGVCDCAFDADAELIWFRSPTDGLWNGSGTANPATGTGGISYSGLTGPVFAATSLYNNAGAQSGTVHLSASSFTHVPPVGFNPYSGGGILSAEWQEGTVAALNALALNSGTLEPVVGSGLAINSGTIVNTETQEWSGGTVSAVGSGLTIAAGGTIEAVIPPSGNTFQSATVLVGSAIPLTTNTPADITSISLENGKWLVYGAVFYENDLDNTTVTRTEAWTSEASATAPTRPNNGAVADNGFPSTVTAAANIYPAGVPSLTVGAQMINVTSGPTTVYLSTTAIFAVSTLSAYGFIGAVPLN